MRIGKRKKETKTSSGTYHEREIGYENFEFHDVTDPNDPDGPRVEVWQDVRGGHTQQRHNLKKGKRKK